MVKTKHQKSSKPKKQPRNKKHGKQADISEFRGQLDALGLKIIQVTADGNCFFRAIADQLEGNEDEHMKYRSMAVQFIMKSVRTRCRGLDASPIELAFGKLAEKKHPIICHDPAFKNLTLYLQ